MATINRLASIYFSESLSDLDLHGPGQLRIILSLSHCEEGITQEALAHHLLVDKGSISRMIRPLLSNGMVVRETDPKDRRAYRVRLSSAIRSRISEIHDKAEQWTEILMKDFDEEERTLCFSYLDRMLQNAHDRVKGADHETDQK